MDRHGITDGHGMILFLAAYMKKGFGVSVVIDSLCKEYARMGVDVTVGCIESDGFFKSAKIVELKPGLEEVRALAGRLKCEVIVAHTTPFFELLPRLGKHYRVWCWEHGDPSPDFFIWDREERQQIIRRKQREVYGRLDGVIAISEFIKSEIRFPRAVVIHNGCDHIDKVSRQQPAGKSTVRVGTLVRLGAGETIYKGRPVLAQLYRKLLNLEARPELHVMGRGTDADRAALEDQGIVAHLNATDEQRLEYLSELDVFVSTSLWEGCNLPLIEAQASGTVALAFDIGAHPETTPFITRGIDEMASLIEFYCNNPGLLRKHSEMTEQWARDRFNWQSAATASCRLLLGEDRH